MSEAAKECDADRGEVPCLSSGCVLREELCDGKRDCEDGFDESGCGDAEQRAMEQLQVGVTCMYLSLTQNPDFQMGICPVHCYYTGYRLAVSTCHSFQDLLLNMY